MNSVWGFCVNLYLQRRLSGNTGKQNTENKTNSHENFNNDNDDNNSDVDNNEDNNNMMMMMMIGLLITMVVGTNATSRLVISVTYT